MKRYLLLENSYDQGTWAAFDKSQWPEGSQLVDFVLTSRWTETTGLARALLGKHFDLRERAFLIHWAVAACELEYHPERRAEALSLWSEVPGWAGDPYCSHLRAMHDGLTRFFAGSLRDAEAHFHQALKFARDDAYERGSMAALFHLGLVEFDRGNQEIARDHFLEALSIAMARGAVKYAARIESVLQLIHPELASTSEEPLFQEKCTLVEKLILEGKAEEARHELLSTNVIRRARQLRRGRESLGVYLGILFCMRGKPALGERLISKIKDPVLKLRVLELKKRAVGLLESEALETDYLRAGLGVSHIVVRADSAEVEVAGKLISSIADTSVRDLMLLLLKSGSVSVSKETIATRIWQLSYDPVLHDNKIYKLILRAKKIFGISDLIVNNYGSYELNPRLLGGRRIA